MAQLFTIALLSTLVLLIESIKTDKALKLSTYLNSTSLVAAKSAADSHDEGICWSGIFYAFVIFVLMIISKAVVKSIKELCSSKTNNQKKATTLKKKVVLQPVVYIEWRKVADSKWEPNVIINWRRVEYYKEVEAQEN